MTMTLNELSDSHELGAMSIHERYKLLMADNSQICDSVEEATSLPPVDGMPSPLTSYRPIRAKSARRDTTIQPGHSCADQRCDENVSFPRRSSTPNLEATSSSDRQGSHERGKRNSWSAESSRSSSSMSCRQKSTPRHREFSSSDSMISGIMKSPRYSTTDSLVACQEDGSKRSRGQRRLSLSFTEGLSGLMRSSLLSSSARSHSLSNSFTSNASADTMGNDSWVAPGVDFSPLMEVCLFED